MGLNVAGLLLIATNNGVAVPAAWLRPLLAVFFLLLLFFQVWPLVLTYRGHFGKRRHPVNKMFGYFSILGILGTVGVALAVFIEDATDAVRMILLLTGPMMFLGIVGSAVLAFFAAPWKDWTYRDPHAPRRSLDTETD